MKATTILDTIGNTPHVRMNRIFGDDTEVWMKLERANPGGSIKDRIALSMIEDAEEKGKLTPGALVIEPTSGNTGIGLAMVCAVKGYKLILVMPESMSIERRRLMSAHGATVELTPRELGMKGAIQKANELIQQTPGSWMPMQFDNEANIEIHRKQTAKEILDDFPAGFDALITGVGTGGHITGVGEILKQEIPCAQSVRSGTYALTRHQWRHSGTTPDSGDRSGFVPKNLHREVLDGVILVTKDEAYDYARRSARDAGIFVGVSTGAALAAVAKKIPELPKTARILTFCYDTGERYLSIADLF